MTGTPPTPEYLAARWRLDGHSQGDIRDPGDTGGPGDRVVDSAFRRFARLQPKLESQIRAIARQQATQGATQTRPAAIASPEALRFLAAIPIKTARCPGEFGPEGWQEHCPPAARKDTP